MDINKTIVLFLSLELCYFYPERSLLEREKANELKIKILFFFSS